MECLIISFRYSASIWEDVEGSIEGRLGITLQLTNEVTSHRFSEFVFWNFDLVSACAEEIMQSVGPLELLPHSAIADSLSSVFWIIFKMSIYFSDNRLTNYFRCSEASKSILIQEMAISAEIETGENKVGEGGRAIASVVSFENINLWSSSFADALLGIANFDHYSEFRIEHVIRYYTLYFLQIDR